MTALLFDLLIEIACESTAAWSAMLAVPEFARWTLTDAGRDRAAARFGSRTIEGHGDLVWRMAGLKHSFQGRPAVIRPDGTREWYWCDFRHRADDLPALMEANGRLVWYWYGVVYRDDDRPSVVEPREGSDWLDAAGHHRALAGDYTDMTIEWHVDGELHRFTGPAVIRYDGTESWYVYGTPTGPITDD